MDKSNVHQAGVLSCSALCARPKQPVALTPVKQGLGWPLPLPTLPSWESPLSLRWTEPPDLSCFEPMAQQHGFLKNSL